LVLLVGCSTISAAFFSLQVFKVLTGIIKKIRKA
jgi:hypothetical protein